MGKVKKFFSDINKSKFKSLYVKNFLFAVSILIVVLFAAITFNDIWLNIIGIFVLFGFSYLTFNVRAIEQNKLYEEVTGVITGYKEKAKADVLTPRLISEECSFIVETDIRDFIATIRIKDKRNSSSRGWSKILDWETDHILL